MTSFDRGFTLVETLVALAIVTGGLLSLVWLARHVTETVARSRRLLAAAVVADASIAQRLGSPLMATALDCLQYDRAGCVDHIDEMGRPAAALPVFHRRWRVVPVAGLSGPVWSLSVCVVPVAERLVAIATPGACVTRVVTETTP